MGPDDRPVKKVNNYDNKYKKNSWKNHYKVRKE